MYSSNQRTMEEIIVDALSNGPVHSSDFGVKYVAAGGSSFTGWSKTDVCRCRNKMVEAGQIDVNWDDRGNPIYSLPANGEVDAAKVAELTALHKRVISIDMAEVAKLHQWHNELLAKFQSKG